VELFSSDDLQRLATSDRVRVLIGSAHEWRGTAVRPRVSGSQRLGWLTARDDAHPKTIRASTWAASALMIASGAIHLHLYTAAYHLIPTIGPLFVVQGVAAVVLALGAAYLRRPWSALVGAASMLATLTGFLISVNLGLFGFQDSFAGTNQVSAFVIELCAAALFVLAAGIAVFDRRQAPRTSSGTP
jgi:hypothetical protein